MKRCWGAMKQRWEFNDSSRRCLFACALRRFDAWLLQSAIVELAGDRRAAQHACRTRRLGRRKRSVPTGRRGFKDQPSGSRFVLRQVSPEFAPWPISPLPARRSTQEGLAEHIKRIRNDYCKGTLRDTLNRFVPQPAGPRTCA